jgi:hypothetical protein
MLGPCSGCVLFMVLLFYLFFLWVLLFSVLYYLLRSLFLGCSADRGLATTSGCAAGLLSSLLGVH